MVKYHVPKLSQMMYVVITTTRGTLCLPQVFYSFNFWLMFRQQLKERKESQSLKAESLDEVKVVPRNLILITAVSQDTVMCYSIILTFFSHRWFSPQQQKKIRRHLWWPWSFQEWRACWWNTGSCSAAPCSLSSASLERYLSIDQNNLLGTFYGGKTNLWLWMNWNSPNLCLFSNFFIFSNGLYVLIMRLNEFSFITLLLIYLMLALCLGGRLQDPLHCPLPFLRCPVRGDCLHSHC